MIYIYNEHVKFFVHIHFEGYTAYTIIEQFDYKEEYVKEYGNEIRVSIFLDQKNQFKHNCYNLCICTCKILIKIFLY